MIPATSVIVSSHCVTEGWSVSTDPRQEPPQPRIGRS